MKERNSQAERRTILKRLGLASLALTIGKPIYDNVLEERIFTPELLKERDQITYWLSQEYGLDAKFLPKGGKKDLEWEEYTGLKNRVDVLREIQREIVKYPPAMIRMVPVQNLSLVYTLKNGGKYVGGLAGDQEIFIVCTEAYLDSFFSSIKRAFHHEILHICDRVDAIRDLDWEQTNPNGFRYIGLENYSPKWMEQRPRGFAQSYGTVSIQEDKATVAEEIFSNYAGIEKIVRDEDDVVLRKKIELTKESYRLLSGGLMDEPFWEDLRYRPHTIKKDYWEQRMRSTRSPGFIQRRLSLRVSNGQ